MRARRALGVQCPGAEGPADVNYLKTYKLIYVSEFSAFSQSVFILERKAFPNQSGTSAWTVKDKDIFK